MKTKTFIIIVTYNGVKWLSKCLNSCIPYSVVLVDNNSNDDTIKFVSKNFPKVTILKQNKNLGFGAANNIGISYALNNDAAYIFLLNQDAYLESKTIEDLIEIHKQNTDFGILSPIHLNGNGKKLEYDFSKYLSVNKELLYDAIKNSFTKQSYDVPFVNAAAWLIPKTTFEKVGGFDPIFFHYGEDDNYCQRILFHNLRIGIIPKTYIFHDREKKIKQKKISGTKNLEYYERSYKQRFANINIQMESYIVKLKQYLMKLVLKHLLKLNFNKALFEIKKYKLLNDLLPEIKKSRKKNRNEGLHYLNSKQNI